MRNPVFVALAIFLIAVLASVTGSYLGVSTVSKSVMPWMCLERCKEQISVDLQQLLDHHQFIADVSVERFDVGPNGKLVVNNFTDVAPTLLRAGFNVYPMLTSANLTNMRTLFDYPFSLIEEIVSIGKANRYTGFNIDFEPLDDPNTADRARFVAFCTQLADALHDANMSVSVDLGHDKDNGLWDWPALSASPVDSLISMGTYCGNTTLFEQRLLELSELIPSDKLVIGLESVNPNTGKPFEMNDVVARFDLVMKYGVRRLAVWQAPVPDTWWPFIEQFLDV